VRSAAPPPGFSGPVSVVVGIYDPRWRKRLKLGDGQTKTVVWQGEL
jgi:hypothetical protein